MTVMSTRAFESFKKEQLDIITKKSNLIVVSIPTIEEIGGGGARCMLAEIFY